MKDEKIKVILVEPWNDVKLANRIAEEAGAKAFVMASAVGAVKGADNYVSRDRLQHHHAGQGAAVVLADLVAILWAPFLMCLVLTGIHAYLGVHVLAREVVFVDIAMAQIAGPGRHRRLSLRLRHRRPGSPTCTRWPPPWWAPWSSRSARSRRRHVSQEAVIGVVYAVSSAAAVLVADRARTAPSTCAACSSAICWRWRPLEVARVAGLYALVGAAALALPPPVLSSSRPIPTRRTEQGWRVRLWDFLFYASFGVVVASSVRVAGVLLSVLLSDRARALAGVTLGGIGAGAPADRMGLRHAGQRPRHGGLRRARPAHRGLPSSAPSA